MSSPAIHIEALGKRYTLGRTLDPHRTFRDALDESLQALRGAMRRVRGHGQEKTDPQEFWALRDVSFEVAQGEAIGILGGNGAGKSTLLKLLSRITEPTLGWAEIRGRVGSLLEVGTGFHADLSGRENVFLNGAILGMRRTEIMRRFDEIVAFAEVERFIDTPVKRYSSGMYLRLAFAVAAHLEPDVLLVDEVLAVGDAAFQRKCVGKMGDATTKGRTVLFVSHNMAAMQALCSRAVWLHQGRVMADGPSGEVISRYLKATQSTRTEQVWSDPATAPGNEAIRLRRVAVVPTASDGARDAITVRMPFQLEFEYWNLKPEAPLTLSVQLYNELGTMVFSAGPVTERVWQGGRLPVGLFRDICFVPGDLLNNGAYNIELLVERGNELVFSMNDLLVFDVHDDAELRQGRYGEWPGVVRPLLQWTTELVTAGVPA